MCGISGYISKLGSEASAGIIQAMNDAVRHRGPDDEGMLVEANVALGHRRLSIVDLSARGHQPMSDAAGGACSIVFNGEIYNYVELRAELAAAGHSFATETDTEVILAAYAQWGPHCVARFNGMWAFAILDRKNRTMFCSRDRYGVKPFYFIDDAARFAFGSEIRQLLPLLASVEPNLGLVKDFILTSRSDHTDDTFFRGVRKLAAGHSLVYSLDTHTFVMQRYYELQRDPDSQALTEDEAIQAYRARLSASVRLRMRADVPVATCLSGGLDSSSVACLAAPLYSEQSGSAFSAITAVSSQQDNDESAYAQQVVKHAGLRWLRTSPGYDDFSESLPAVVQAQEEPFTSPSVIMQYFVMKTARENGIRVLLDGQGGDETLMGYDKYYAAYFATTLKRDGLRTALRNLANARRHNANMTLRRTAKYVVAGLFSGLRFRMHRWQHSYLREPGQVPEHLRAFSRASLDDFEIQKLEIERTNLPLLLRYEDKNSMHHSVEARLPFLDYQALELALSMPGEYKIRDGWSKWVLRKCMDGIIPSSIAWRRNKLSFEAPEDMWLQKHHKIMREAVFGSALLGRICDLSRLEAKFDRLDKRSRWRLYSIAMWEQAFGVKCGEVVTG